MVKTGGLSKVEKYYIEGNLNMPIKDIALELDRSEKIIKKYSDTLDKEEIVEKLNKIEKEKNEPQMFKMMGRHERNGQKVATVMTSGASELADSKRHKHIANKKIQSAIHKPRG